MSEVFDVHAAHRLLPVVVVDRVDRAVPLAQTLSGCGLPSAEVTLRTPDALSVISAMAALPGFMVGAGTVLGPEQAAHAVAAGARYLVSPGFSPAVDRECRLLDVPYVPGVATATEVQTALDAGRDVVKLFPAAVVGGARLVAALSAPFPTVRFVPTGGIRAADLADYLSLPAVLAVGGTWLAPPDVVETGDWARVADETRAATAVLEQFR
ncbi:bifunctional 4-hydroxy-2-oxoglutarate aldolase/2-dehydro-3-deoxy-phosphogluconate aldolase [Nocardioides dilutus]